jgi:hypothetical protein
MSRLAANRVALKPFVLSWIHQAISVTSIKKQLMLRLLTSFLRKVSDFFGHPI